MTEGHLNKERGCPAAARAGIIRAALMLLVFLFSLGGQGFCQEQEETRLYQQGSKYCMDSKWSAAAVSFERLLSRHPATRYADARFWLGYSYVEMEKFKEGIDTLERFAREHPSNSYAAQALYKVGEVYEKRLKDYDSALQAYDRVVNTYPGNTAAMPAVKNQAMIYSQQKFDYSKAIERFERSKSLAQEQGISSQSGYFQKADQRIRFIRENSDYGYEPLKIFSMGMNKEEDRRWNEAVGIYETLLRKYPKANIADDAEYRLISCLVSLNRKGEAAERARAFLEKYARSPHSGKIRAILQNVEEKRGDFPQKGTLYFV
jgi:TolA-binding protein